MCCWSRSSILREPKIEVLAVVFKEVPDLVKMLCPTPVSARFLPRRAATSWDWLYKYVFFVCVTACAASTSALRSHWLRFTGLSTLALASAFVVAGTRTLVSERTRPARRCGPCTSEGAPGKADTCQLHFAVDRRAEQVAGGQPPSRPTPCYVVLDSATYRDRRLGVRVEYSGKARLHWTMWSISSRCNVSSTSSPGCSQSQAPTMISDEEELTSAASTLTGRLPDPRFAAVIKIGTLLSIRCSSR
jgi:hypothetical protein